MRTFFAVIAAIFLTFAAGCASLFFYPEKKHIDNPAVRAFNPEDVFFRTADGLTLHGWLLRPAGRSRASILVLHGNAQNVSTHVNGVLWLVNEGFAVFIFDYRGYGWSEGRPSLAGVHLDAEAAFEVLLTLPGLGDTPVIVLGQSLGGAVAVYTVAHSAHKERITALVLDSAFSSYRRIAREKLADFFVTWPFQLPLSYFFNDEYSPVTWIKQVSPVPVLILHGVRDDVVPLHHGERLFDAVLPPKDFRRTLPPGHIQSFADAAVRRELVSYIDNRLQAARDPGLAPSGPQKISP